MISVCIATYNGEKYIKEQLRSILSQLGDKDEIIISDDRSTDSTVEIIESIGDLRIKIFLNDNHRHKLSLISNFENALMKASGDYIFLSDQDDIWEKNKVDVMLMYLLSNDVVLSNATVVDYELKLLSKSLFDINHSKKGVLKNIIKNSFVGCCMAFNKKVLHAVLPFPKDIPMHDMWIGFVGGLFFRTIFIDDKLIKYRRHELNVSNTSEHSNFSVSRKISFRFNCVKYIFYPFFRH